MPCCHVTLFFRYAWKANLQGFPSLSVWDKGGERDKSGENTMSRACRRQASQYAGSTACALFGVAIIAKGKLRRLTVSLSHIGKEARPAP